MRFFIALFAWAGTCALAQDWNGLTISKISGSDLPEAEAAVLAEALGLKVGRSLDPEKLNAALVQLGSGGKWMRVFVDGAAEGRSVRLTLRGERVRRLRKLEFTEVQEDVLEEVRRKVRQDHEQNADLESFSTLRQALKEAYQDRGFYFAQVQFITKSLDDDEADVEVKVVPGSPTHINRLAVRGGPDAEVAALTELVPVQRGDIFSRIKLNTGVEKINDYLRANQYPTSRVADTTLQFNPGSSEVDVTIIVKLGERFQIRFIGNRVFSDVALKALMTEEVLAQPDPAAKIAQLVESKYHAVGYPDCAVDVKKTLVENGKLNLMELVVHEGPRTMIEDVRFSTGDRISGVDLESLFYDVAVGVLERRLYWAEGMAETVASMRSFLQANGYLNARISEPKATFSEDRRSVVLFFDADVGVQTHLKDVEVVGAKSFSKSDFADEFAFELDEPLNRAQVVETGARIVRFYANSGFPDAKLTKAAENSIEISRDQQSAVVRYELEEGRRYTIGSVQVEGLRKTKPKVVLQEMEVETSSVYSARKIRSSEERISLIGLFSKVEIVETKNPSDPGVIDLRVVVRETRPGVGEMGIGTLYEEPRLRIRPFIGVTYRNVSGLNQTASIRADLGVPISRLNGRLDVPFVEYSTVFGYRYPYALGLPVTFAAQLGLDRIEVQPTDQTLLTRARFEGKLEKKFSPRFTGIYRLLRVERTTTFSQLTPASSATTESIGSTGPGLILDLRDDIFNPRWGSFHSLDLEFATPLLFSEADLSFMLGVFRNSFYIPLGESVQLAMFAGIGVAHSFSSRAIARARLVNELSLGGQGSIRGITPRILTPALTSQDMAFYNGRFEMTIRLFDEFGLAVFFDTGQIFPDFKAQPRSDGVGIGLRYRTPVGPVVIDFARGLGNFGDQFKFYFTVGTF